MVVIPFCSACQQREDYDKLRKDFDVVYEQQDYEQALILGERILPMENAIADSAKRSFIYFVNRMGLAALHAKKLSNAEEYFKKALVLMEEAHLQGSSGYLTTADNLVDSYYRQGKYSLAITTLTNLIELRYRRDSTDALIGRSYYDLGFIYTTSGYPDSAYTVLEKANYWYTHYLPNDIDGISKVAQELAATYIVKGDYRNARTTLQNALDRLLPRRGKNNERYVVLIAQLGYLDLLQRNYNSAEKRLEESYNIFQSLGVNEEPALFLFRYLATLYSVQGKKELAEQFFKEGMQRVVEYYGQDNYRVGEILMFSGEYHFHYQEYVQAEELFQEALSIFENVFGKQSRRTAEVLIRLRLIYMTVGRVKEAEELSRRIDQIVGKT